MSLKRKTIIFVSGVALAAWFAAAMTPGRPPAPSRAFRPAPIDTKGADLAVEIARLRERLTPDAAPREASRNPFVFGSSQHAASAARAVAPLDKHASALPPGIDVIEPRRLRLTLAGIAEDPAPADTDKNVSDVNNAAGPPVRTAIIVGNGQVFLAKEGDTVTDRGSNDVEYRVEKISGDSAELIDLRNGSVIRLTLR